MLVFTRFYALKCEPGRFNLDKFSEGDTESLYGTGRPPPAFASSGALGRNRPRYGTSVH